MARGDVGGLTDAFDRHLYRVERHLADADPDLPPGGARDAAAIAAVSLTMLGIKALKVLPGIPFLPGYKGVLLIPLYLVAARLTRTRMGATLTGLTMGTVAFLLGDGRYGVFEIAKHVAPGLVVDLLYPLVVRVAAPGTGRLRRIVAWSAIGFLAAIGRFATITVVALAVQPPALVFAVLLPGLLVHGIFGVLSGIVTAPLLAAFDRDRRTQESS
ncbi:MAG: hypothetical protein HS111_33915 [Kofleriaceae bacterium]|nr:hypothetical protein [Kofleriaceae bacterium]